MKGYSFTPAKSRPSSLISSSERTERRGDHKDTTEETTKAVEEVTAAPADPAVAWAMGASNRQVEEDRRRRGRFNDGVIRHGTRDASSCTVAITAKVGQDW